MAKQTKRTNPRNFSLSGFLLLVRWPNLVIIMLGQYLTTYFLADSLHSILQWDIAVLSLSTVIIAAAGYLINDYYDVKIDYINRPERVVVDKVLKRRVVMVVHTVMNFAGIGLVSILSWKLGLLYFFAAFSLWLYSNQLKRMPFIGNLAVSCMSAGAIAVVAFYFQKNELLVYTYAVFAFCISLIREIIKDMEDLKGDQIFGCKTLPIVWGIRKTKKYIYILIAIFYVSLYLLSHQLNNQVLIYYFSLLTVFIAYFIWRLYRADTKKDFYFLSQYIKGIMLSGVLSMMFF
jgi:4-hydroxybenzoate polyprenyltransferase